jgi:hypothetical protein
VKGQLSFVFGSVFKRWRITYYANVVSQDQYAIILSNRLKTLIILLGNLLTLIIWWIYYSRHFFHYHLIKIAFDVKKKLLNEVSSLFCGNRNLYTNIIFISVFYSRVIGFLVFTFKRRYTNYMQNINLIIHVQY